MSAATISRMKAKAKIAHDKKTNELLGSSIQRDLITNLSSTELQQWIDEHQTNLLEISKRRGHIKEALDILDAKIAKKNANTRKNKKKNERKKAKKSKRASPPEPTLASPPEPTHQQYHPHHFNPYHNSKQYHLNHPQCFLTLILR